MGGDGVLLSFVFPALTFARVGSELDRSPASFVDRLLDQPGLPHISRAFRGHRAHVLESVIFFPSSVGYWEELRRSLTLGEAPGALWTIPVELTFYLYLPIVLALAAGATRSRCGAAVLGSAYLAWCVAIALARRNGAPASLWMTLGFHHYAHSLVGRGLFYARLANGRIRFPRCGGCLVWIAPIGFLCAYPFLYFALFRGGPSMAELARPGAWISYYDAVFPIAPLVVGG